MSDDATATTTTPTTETSSSDGSGAETKPENASETTIEGEQVAEIGGEAESSQEGGEGSEGGDSETSETEKPTADMHKVKIDGIEKEMTLSQLVAAAQKGAGADKRFQEAAEIRKQATAVIRALRENPMAVLRHPSLGFSDEKLQELFEEQLYERAMMENMSEEEREKYELKKKVEQYEEDRRKQKEESEQKELAELTKQAKERIEGEIIEALKTSGLPQTIGTVRRIAYYMSEARKRAMKLDQEDPLPPGADGKPRFRKALGASDVLPLVRKDYEREFKDLYSQAPVETLVELLGSEVAGKLRKHDLSQLRKPQGGTPTKQAKPTGKLHKRMSFEEWQKRTANRVSS